ncbi:MAG: tRNA(Ile)(2)-agmatinylcytidine synthase [Candidatus Bathyarchaeia archaeon]
MICQPLKFCDIELTTKMRLHIGFDDTDSPRTGCTTYVAALLIEEMRKIGVNFVDFPNLIRLNPNVPWKTRGNGALCLRITCEECQLKEIKECVIDTVEENSDLSYEGTDPGIVFFPGDVSSEVEAFAQNAIQGLVKITEALRLIKHFKAEAVGFKSGRGIIGGLAAVGERLRGDYTYELITYRTPENRGTPRKVDVSSIAKMDAQMKGLTFNNIDAETKRILITPRGPDPILYGIRGETPEAVKLAHELIISEEPIERWVIFKTNHGTDAHLKRVKAISEVRPYNPVILQGKIANKPRVIQGGHVVFQVQDETGRIDCVSYEPTGNLREVAKALIIGDFVEVCGGIRPPSSKNPMTLNLEKIQILTMASNVMLQNPLCPVCRKRMKSMGKNQGFECKKCNFHGRNMAKTVMEIERPIKPGLFVTPPRSQRHLTKPLSRYGKEKTEPFQNYEGVIPYELFSRL